MLETKKVKKAPSASNDIQVVGARVHNLKNVNALFPRNQFIVVTGVSGSGKSSLTIDTLFAEGQRRYAESLSSYARQFMSRMGKPDVDYIKGLCPAIAIEQKVVTRTPRSTVGSMTEIYDYLRVFYARVGKTISPISGQEVKKQDVQDVLDFIQKGKAGDKMVIIVPFKQQAKRDIQEELNILLQKGFARIYLRAGGASVNDKKAKAAESTSTILRIEDALAMTKAEITKLVKAHDVYVLIDRVVVKDFDEDDIHRISDSIGTAFYEGEGLLWVEQNDTILKTFNNKFTLDGIEFDEPSPNLFSFNNPYGACPTCEGYSQVLGIDENLVIPNPNLSVYDGGVAPWKGEKLVWWKDQFVKEAGKAGFPIHQPINKLTKTQETQLWKGVGKALGIDAFFEDVKAHLYKVQFRVMLSRYRGRTNCSDCEGYRVRKEALYVKIGGKHIGELCAMPVRDLQIWFTDLKLSAHDTQVAKRLLIELEQRIQTLMDVGLGYLTLSRLANSLSGGESQRIQLTRCLGSNLTNSLYILDEPSIGLHSRDTERLIKVLQNLRDLGNTVVVVEHDEQIMRHADYIIDMGPLAAHQGGEIVAAGNAAALIKDKNSLTGKYLSGVLSIPIPDKTRVPKHFIKIEGAYLHNLKTIDVQFPLHSLCVVSGVSGSGKTTLVKQVLYNALLKAKQLPTEIVGGYNAISGDLHLIDQIEMVDQNPIGKSSRSNPVTYIKAYDAIRDLYSKQALSKIRGFLPKHFSFNVDGGRCDTCKGEGEQLVEMQFLADVHLTCEDCNGKRFKEAVLEVQYKGKNIYEVLEMSVDEAIAFFSEEKNIVFAISPLQEVGLGYVKLGQSSSTLSGGEAQRVKLASFLGKGKASNKMLFIFDEPTTGLHFHDIHKLLKAFNALIEQGHSLIVVEHNTDVIKVADWVIDMGPEAGVDGGTVVYAGIPKGLSKCKASQTGKYLD
ncbi:MAG: excinuclease ABC subunit UvrA [Sediminibacterium sp.]|nr:excinuclease ABC subunit UvrA [Sediminibacterium sp.]